MLSFNCSDCDLINGSSVTGPVLIYQDEILFDNVTLPLTIGDPNRSGALVCRSENSARNVRWHLPHHPQVTIAMAGQEYHSFKQILGNASLSRLSINEEGIARDDGVSNGLWTCRESGTANYVLYGGGTGE